MSEPIVLALLAAASGIAAAYFAYRQAAKVVERTASTEAMKIEAGAYERARSLYEDGIRQLEQQVERLRQQLTDEVDVSAKLRRQVNELEYTVALLRRQLINAGVELSPPRPASA